MFAERGASCALGGRGCEEVLVLGRPSACWRILI